MKRITLCLVVFLFLNTQTRSNAGIKEMLAPWLCFLGSKTTDSPTWAAGEKEPPINSAQQVPLSTAFENPIANNAHLFNGVNGGTQNGNCTVINMKTYTDGKVVITIDNQKYAPPYHQGR